MSELSRTAKGVRASVAGLAATAALLSGCSPKHHGESIPNFSNTTSAPNPALHPNTTTTTPDVFTYFMNPARNHRLDAVVQAFGAKVLADSETRNSSWAPFDTYCAPDNGIGEPAGWISQGFIPKAGDGCYVQHNPQYGGSHDQISTDALVGVNGFTGKFDNGSVNTQACPEVSIGYNPGDKLWDSSYQMNGGANVVDAQTASSTARAEAIDNFAINCLSKTI